MTEDNLTTNDKREYIIEKCYDCYIKGGIENTSIRDFCRAGNLNPNTIYYYFKDKDEILFECVNFGYRKLEDAMYDAVEHGTPNDMFIKLRDIWVSFSPEMRFLVQAVSSPTYEKNRMNQFAKVDEFYKRFGKKIAQRFDCPYDVIRSYVYEIFVLISYYSLWGSIDMAALQCYKIFQNLLKAVEDFKKQNNVDFDV